MNSTNRLLCILIALIAASIGLDVLILHQQNIRFRGSVPPISPGSRPAQSAETDMPAGEEWDAPSGTTIELRGLPTEGDPAAKLVLVEFADYECPYCASHASKVLPKLREEFISTGKLKYAFVNFPIPAHENAKILATAAICSGKQNRYWAMHDALFNKQPRTRADILRLTATLGLDRIKFEECLNNDEETKKQIDADVETALRLRLRFTPSFALGTMNSAGSISVQRFFVGAQPIEFFERAISAVSTQAS